MENVSVPELRVEANGLGLERYSKRRKQDLIQWISYIPDYPVPNIYAPLLTPTRYVPVKPQLNECEQKRSNEIREVKEMLGLRNRPKATPKVIPKIKISSPEEGERDRKIR